MFSQYTLLMTLLTSMLLLNIKRVKPSHVNLSNFSSNLSASSRQKLNYLLYWFYEHKKLFQINWFSVQRAPCLFKNYYKFYPAHNTFQNSPAPRNLDCLTNYFIFSETQFRSTSFMELSAIPHLYQSLIILHCCSVCLLDYLFCKP